MPELPEVETVKRGLEEFIINENINKVYISNLVCDFRGQRILFLKLLTVR